MASPIIYFNNFIGDLKSKNPQLSIEDVKSELYKNSIMTKHYDDSFTITLAIAESRVHIGKQSNF